MYVERIDTNMWTTLLQKMERAHYGAHADCMFPCKSLRGDGACLSVPGYRNRSTASTTALLDNVFRVFK